MTLSARSQATTRRTYNRPLDDEGTKFETWEDTIHRAQYRHHLKLWEDEAGALEDHKLAELEELEGYGLDRSGLVAGRTLWLGGTPYSYSRAASQFNCSGLELFTVYDMVDAFWLLLNGCGVGGIPRSGTLHGYSTPVPVLEVIPTTRDKAHRGNPVNVEVHPKADNGHTWTIVVGDSAEAWAKVPGKMLLAPRGNISRLVLDFSDVRGAGGRLRGYGWICNGYKPLVEALTAIHHILNGAAGNLLDEEEIGDIFNWFGTVLSSRRAAESLQLDRHHPRQGEFGVRKRDYWVRNPQRRQSNNSHIWWTRPSRADLQDLLELNLVGGEPGIVNGCAAVMKCPWFRVFNPCFEIMLPSHGFCVSGDTILVTRTGARKISDTVDTQVQVWNGNKWSWVTPKITGKDQQLVRVTLSDGSKLDCTPYHRFSVQGRKLREVKAKHLKVGDVLEQFRMEDPEGQAEIVPEEAAYTLGVLCGDGSAEGSEVDRGRKWVELTLYGGKKHLPVLGTKSKEVTLKGYAQSVVNVTGFTQLLEERCDVDPVEMVHDVRRDGDYLLRVLGWSKKSMLAFLAGMADTDGSETGTGGIRIYGQENTCRILQLILRKCGMRSSVCLMSKRGKLTNFGRRNKSMWYVSVVECQTIPCHRLDTSGGHEPGKNGKGAVQKVVSVQQLPGRHTVYCFDEPENHKAVFANVLTHQCNLVSLCLPSFGRNFRRLERAVYVMARANYRQTCVDLRDGVLQPRWHQTNEALRLCGVSFTGIVHAGWLTDYQVRRLRNAAVTGAYSMADELGRPRPKAVTTIKPEGTRTKISGLVDAEYGEGIHMPPGRHVFNWINFSKDDPLVEALDAAGYKVIQNPSDSNNVLVRFPVAYADCDFTRVGGKLVNQEPAVDQLRRYRRWNNLWADHNVSATISFDREEIPDVADWIYRHWDDGYIATAFQARVDVTKTAADLGHPYLPQEVVTEADFAGAVDQLRPVEWDRFHHGWHEITDASDCPTGVCPVR